MRTKDDPNVISLTFATLAGVINSTRKHCLGSVKTYINGATLWIYSLLLTHIRGL